jgi:hypothetical protein
MPNPLHGSLSVVIPTYNCLSLLKRHVAEMAAWLDLADEVIVVDSRSKDGTREYLAENLRHPGLRFIDRDRGLYQSWNEGIAATTGDWIYVSTAGDTIQKYQLERLRRCGEASGADVVISPCQFVDENGLPIPDAARRKPIIFRKIGDRAPFLLPPQVVKHLAFHSAGTHALLGSCASDLFRGNFLRGRPFPVDYGTHGDTAWTLRHAHEMRLCVVPETGSTFCIHAKEMVETKRALMDTLDRMFATEFGAGGSTVAGDLPLQVRGLMRQRREIWHDRGSVISWLGSNLKYIPQRAALGVIEAKAWRRLRELVIDVELT